MDVSMEGTIERSKQARSLAKTGSSTSDKGRRGGLSPNGVNHGCLKITGKEDGLGSLVARATPPRQARTRGGARGENGQRQPATNQGPASQPATSDEQSGARAEKFSLGLSLSLAVRVLAGAPGPHWVRPAKGLGTRVALNMQDGAPCCQLPCSFSATAWKCALHDQGPTFSCQSCHTCINGVPGSSAGRWCMRGTSSTAAGAQPLKRLSWVAHRR